MPAPQAIFDHLQGTKFHKGIRDATTITTTITTTINHSMPQTASGFWFQVPGADGDVPHANVQITMDTFDSFHHVVKVCQGLTSACSLPSHPLLCYVGSSMNVGQL